MRPQSSSGSTMNSIQEASTLYQAAHCVSRALSVFVWGLEAWICSELLHSTTEVTALTQELLCMCCLLTVLFVLLLPACLCVAAVALRGAEHFGVLPAPP